MRNLFWTALVGAGVLFGLFIGLAIAPDISNQTRWLLALASGVLFVGSWLMKRRQR